MNAQVKAIRDEIDRRIAGNDDSNARVLKGILAFIDSLPDEPENNDTGVCKKVLVTGSTIAEFNY